MKNKNIKCSICGKFIKYDDIYNNKIIIEFVPDTPLTIERTIFTHKKCKR